MGSFRSEPELNKHTHTGAFEKINFAVSHMCGIALLYHRMEALYGGCSHFQCPFYR